MGQESTVRYGCERAFYDLVDTLEEFIVNEISKAEERGARCKDKDSEDPADFGSTLWQRQPANPVRCITLCYQFGYHKKPFLHGVRDGKDVWLRDDGEWTEDESDDRIGLAVKLSFYPGGNWHGDKP